MSKIHYSSIRVKPPIRTVAGIKAASLHAAGKDATARAHLRDGAGEHRALSCVWHDGGYKPGMIVRGVESIGTDYLSALNAFTKDNGIATKKGGQLCLHLLCIVTPEAIKGDPHDPDNPEVRRLLADAIKWGDHAFGTDGSKATFAARYDIDEHGSGVVDLLVAPNHVFTMGRGEAKRRVACHAGLERLGKRHEQFYTYSACQDSWNKWMNEQGWDLRRGEPKAKTKREHLSPEGFKDDLERRTRLASRAVRQAADIIERDPSLVGEARALAVDATACLDRDIEAQARLADYYRESGDKTPAHAYERNREVER